MQNFIIQGFSDITDYICSQGIEKVLEIILAYHLVIYFLIIIDYSLGQISILNILAVRKNTRFLNLVNDSVRMFNVLFYKVSDIDFILV